MFYTLTFKGFMIIIVLCSILVFQDRIS